MISTPVRMPDSENFENRDERGRILLDEMGENGHFQGSNSYLELRSVSGTTRDIYGALPRSKGVTSHYVYVDNFGIQSWEEQAAKEGLDAVTAAFQEKHQTVHETGIQCEKASAFGVVLDGRRLETRAQEARLRRVRSAIGVVLRRKRTVGMRSQSSAWPLHVPGLGKEAAAQLLPRQATGTCNRRTGPETVLWSTVVDELTHFSALTIFCFSQWWPPWCTEVFSTDVSLYGYGLAASDWTRGDVAEAGRRSERSRYGLGAGNAREHALGQMGFVVDRASGKVREAAPDDEVSIPLLQRIDGKRTLLSRKSLCLFLRGLQLSTLL